MSSAVVPATYTEKKSTNDKRIQQLIELVIKCDKMDAAQVKKTESDLQTLACELVESIDMNAPCYHIEELKHLETVEFWRQTLYHKVFNQTDPTQDLKIESMYKFNFYRIRAVLNCFECGIETRDTHELLSEMFKEINDRPSEIRIGQYPAVAYPRITTEEAYLYLDINIKKDDCERDIKEAEQLLKKIKQTQDGKQVFVATEKDLVELVHLYRCMLVHIDMYRGHGCNSLYNICLKMWVEISHCCETIYSIKFPLLYARPVLERLSASALCRSVSVDACIIHSAVDLYLQFKFSVCQLDEIVRRDMKKLGIHCRSPGEMNNFFRKE